MIYLICGLSFFTILLIALPSELFYRKNSFKEMIQQNDLFVNLSVKNDNKLLNLLLSYSRRIQRLIPVKPNLQKVAKIEKTIQYAGLQNKISVQDFFAMKSGIAVLCWLYFLIMLIAHPSQLMFMLMMAAAFMGYMIPNNWISMRAKNRMWNIEKDVPSILSSLAVVTDAGLNLLQAIEEVTKKNSGEFSKELKKTLEDLKIGISQKDAFERLAERCNVEEINLFVSALVQSFEKGSSGITELIRFQAKESWEKRKHKAKELAEKASMKLFLPLLLLVLPSFIIFLMGPMVFSLAQMFK
ncbi:MAG: type II secretion system F family protein [Aminipila sp.]